MFKNTYCLAVNIRHETFKIYGPCQLLWSHLGNSIGLPSFISQIDVNEFNWAAVFFSFFFYRNAFYIWRYITYKWWSIFFFLLISNDKRWVFIRNGLHKLKNDCFAKWNIWIEKKWTPAHLVAFIIISFRILLSWWVYNLCQLFFYWHTHSCVKLLKK